MFGFEGTKLTKKIAKKMLTQYLKSAIVSKCLEFRHYELDTFGPVAQLVRAPPCHGGGQGFEPPSGRFFMNIFRLMGS